METAQTSVPNCSGPATAQPQMPELTCSVRLSERDEAEVLATAESPPSPKEAALQAARRFLRGHARNAH